MRNLYILIVFFIFIIRKDGVILGATNALSFWCKNIFPILFPTFILAGLILSSSIVTFISSFLGKIFKRIFKTNECSSFVFLISLLCGTPTNVKILKSLYDDGIITSDEVNKIMVFTYFFNPFLIISFAGVRVLFIVWISNILTGILLRNKYTYVSSNKMKISRSFNLSESISANLSIILNILGTITVFMCISYSVPFINPFFNVVITSIMELSTALFKIKMYFSIDYFYLVALSLGGISILMQIKSILKDTLIDYKFIIKSRILTLIISLIICCLT